MPAKKKAPALRDDIVYDDDTFAVRRSRAPRVDEAFWHDDDAGKATARVERELEKRRKSGETLRAALPSHARNLSNTFWGQSWNRNLMSYSDYESRMPRGRTYFRSGKVMDLAITRGRITATVAGSRIYDIQIRIAPLDDETWATLKKRCQGKIGGLVELLSGQLSDEVMQEVTRPQGGLFPAPGEMKLSCTCPDFAGLCKHLAATLYATGSHLDEHPAALFTLRGVDPQEMIARDAKEAVAHLTAPADVEDKRAAALHGLDLTDVFGL
jgi:uncharacterized Zn finger protein